MNDEEKKVYEDRIRELSEALRVARLKSEAYNEMIKVTEERFKIPIRKKSNTKQSEE